MRLIIDGEPRTKKNSQRIVTNGKKRFVLPSAVYVDYEQAAIQQIGYKVKKVDYPVNVQCIYYMRTHRKVDLVNLIEATCDILVRCGVLADDNSNIVRGHDGSKVMYDKDKPRAEIIITPIREDKPTPNCKDCADTHCGCYGMDCAAVCGGKRFVAKDSKNV